MPLVSSANRGYTVSPHDLKAHGLEGHGWYGRVRQGGTERVFGRQLLSLGGAQILFFAPKRGEKIKESQIEGGGRVGCGRPWQRLREGGGLRGLDTANSGPRRAQHSRTSPTVRKGPPSWEAKGPLPLTIRRSHSFVTTFNS